MSDPDAPPVQDLPEVVRLRVVTLVSEVLPGLTPLPASLRKVAAFTPARRARAGGASIGSALADESFRERAATQVRARFADRASAVESDPAPGADLADRGALLWLLRPQDWAAQLSDTLAQVALQAPQEPLDREVLRLRARVELAETSLREVRAEHRAKSQELRAEISTLRSKLADARGAAREARAELEIVAASRDQAEAAVERAAGRTETEVRRLRAQVDQLSAELQALRRESKGGRDEATVRSRLLLDTLLEAATGLRRELALPPLSQLPADAVQAQLADPGVSTSGVAGTLEPGSPALLEHLLALPRVHLIVDGYNVSKTAWPTLSLEAQRTRLLAALAPMVARTGTETTVVFDAHSSTSRPVASAPRGVRVVFSPVGVIADQVIAEFVSAEPVGRVVVVVTSDQALSATTRQAGARVVWATALTGLFSRP